MEKKELVVKLTLIDDVKKFVAACSKSECDVTILSGRYQINGKSLLGLFSLDLSTPIIVEIKGTEADTVALSKEIETFKYTE